MEQEPDRKKTTGLEPDSGDTPESDELAKQYHPAFCAAMTQIFEEDACKYEYEREHNLNSMPNRIDFMIVKKEMDKESDNGIGKIFRRYNIFEYKSPGQALDLDTYHLNMAYAHLYAHYEKDAALEDITLSFVREGKPVKLMNYFKGQGFIITEPEAGIYHIRKSGHIDMQVIVTKKLGSRYIWLKALTGRLTREEAMQLAREAGKEKDPQGQKRVRSILDLVSNLNKNKHWMKEMVTMGIRDLFKEEFEEKDHKIAEQGDKIAEQDNKIAEQDRQIQDLNKRLENQSEQLQSQSEQLQSKEKQLQSGQEEITKLRKELEELKKQIGKIAVL